MRKKILLGSAAAFALVFAASHASADVTVTATIDKTKDISVNEFISIDKVVTIDVIVDITAAKAAEVDSLINQANHGNTACENCAEKLDEIIDSINGNSGIATANQSSGNNNNQGSVLTAAVDNFSPPPQTPTPGQGGFAEAQAAVDQRNGVVEGPERVADANIVDSTNILFRTGQIIDSIGDNLGLVMVNQAPGQMNNQANNVAIAISLAAGGVALSEADLGQETSNNETRESVTAKNAEISGSVSGNTGITLVNQAVGNMANQANVLSLSAATLGQNL